MEINKTARAAAAGLTLSLAGFAGYVAYEGYSATATPPVKGDVPTYGFGTTRSPDGKSLKGGEIITATEAVRLAVRDVTTHESGLKRCMGDVKLTQNEFDALMSLALNVGPTAVCNSSIPAKGRAGDYEAMCKAILDFDKYCTQPKTRNSAGKLVCPPGALKPLKGLTARRKKEYLHCIGLAEAGTSLRQELK
ncbi:MAG: glycoside hydrolase family protein [Azoarcus sp.]|jgi:lysozyme|nr:glycoside hydrolase family protein [Azoarcus sp.]